MAKKSRKIIVLRYKVKFGNSCIFKVLVQKETKKVWFFLSLMYKNRIKNYL